MQDFSIIGGFMAPQTHKPKYIVKRHSLKLTCPDPQIWEMECEDRTILYARFSNGGLTCREKRTGDFICSGIPVLDKTEIPENKIEFYLEMYSQHEIYFQ